jgi:hypothetical protein
MRIDEVTCMSLTEENIQQLINSVNQRGIYGPAVARAMADINRKNPTLSSSETFQAALEQVAAEAEVEPQDIENNMKTARRPAAIPRAPKAVAARSDDTNTGSLIKDIGAAARNMRNTFSTGAQAGQAIFRALDRR